MRRGVSAVIPVDVLVGTVDETPGDLGGTDPEFVEVIVFRLGVAVVAEAVVVVEEAVLAVLDEFVKF